MGARFGERDKCVVLYNSGGNKSSLVEAEDVGAGGTLAVGVAWEMLGWAAGSRVEVRDLWAMSTLGNFTGGFNASLKARDVQMLRVTRLG